MKLIGRTSEQSALKEYLMSDKPEFVAVYGRRRVGKTFLIKEYFKNDFAFYLTGIANSGTRVQLRNFNDSLHKYGETPYPQMENWVDTFGQLKHLLENSKKRGKKVIFLDEMPWLDTPRSGFISALEYFWNSWASSRTDILLVVCGSATSWMINKLIRNRGGLHNRVTRRMFIEPFSLGECSEYFRANKIELNKYQVVESYMVLGGIPYYLSLMQKGLSLAQNIDQLCFAPNGALRDEFSNLYASLFKHSEHHVKIVEGLSKKVSGMTREEILAATKLPYGGGFSKVLEELEQCGFIRSYRAFGKKSRKNIYQLMDFYSLFYLNFIRDNKYSDEHFWSNSIETPRHRAWSGYAFEQICLAHVKQIKAKLGISGILTSVSAWRSKESEAGAQIDLLIDRNDGVINLCEMKYSNEEFAIDKNYEANLRNKKGAFVRESATRKAVHITMVTTYGVKHNAYSGIVQSEVVMDDLFKPI